LQFYKNEIGSFHKFALLLSLVPVAVLSEALPHQLTSNPLCDSPWASSLLLNLAYVYHGLGDVLGLVVEITVYWQAISQFDVQYSTRVDNTSCESGLIH